MDELIAIWQVFFEYAKAMKNSKITWNEKTLDRFLAKPLEMVPGSSMTYEVCPIQMIGLT